MPILAQQPQESKEVEQPRSIPYKIEGRFVGYVTVTDGDTYAIEIKALPVTPRTLLLNGQPWSLDTVEVQQ